VGQKLAEYYKKAEQMGGKKAILRLGLLTCVPLIFADNLDDSPENIDTFEKAIKEIEKEYNTKERHES